MRSVFSTVALVPLRPSGWSKRMSKSLTKKYGPSVIGSPLELQTTSHQSWSKVRHLWSYLDRLGVQARLSDWNMDLRFFSLQHDQKVTSKLFTQNSRNSPMSSQKGEEPVTTIR